MINWDAVEAAMERSLHGRASAEDGDLCRTAYDKEPKRYRELHAVVRERAHRSMNPLAEEKDG
jgi:hypothetical protein